MLCRSVLVVSALYALSCGQAFAVEYLDRNNQFKVAIPDGWEITTKLNGMQGKNNGFRENPLFPKIVSNNTLSSLKTMTYVWLCDPFRLRVRVFTYQKSGIVRTPGTPTRAQART